MLLVGIVAPLLGMFVLRVVYHSGRIEMLLYYVLFTVHVFVVNGIMAMVSGLNMPFFVYVYGRYLESKAH